MSDMSERRASLSSRIKQANSDLVATSSCGEKHSATAASLASTQGKKHKSTISDDDGGEDAEDTSCVSDLPVGKRCSGCERVTGNNKSFYVPSKPFACLYVDGRGEWRKDCGNTFRLMFKCAMSLPTLSRWILDHRAEYLGTLLAVVTLRKEGVKHLSTAVIEKTHGISELAL